MSDLGTVLLYDLRRFFKFRNLLILIVLFVYAVILLFIGNSEYRDTLSRSKQFQDLDAAKVRQLGNYDLYTVYGARFLFIPAPLGPFLQASGMSAHLAGRVDSIITLDITINGKSSAIFEEDKTSPLRFTFIVLLLGPLFALYAGIEVPGERKFLKSLGCVKTPGKIFWCLIFSRIILLTAVLIVFFGALFGVLKILGIDLTNSDITNLLGYFKAIWFVIISFFSAGVLIGSTRNQKKQKSKLLAVWMIFVFFLPGGLDSIISKISGNITASYKAELKQLEIVNDFEKQAFEKVGKFTEEKRPQFAELAEIYQEEVYPKIEAIENDLKAELASVMETKNEISMFLPTTFLQTVGKEVSGFGYKNRLNFYGCLQQKKREFLKFWKDQVYYKDHTKVVNFNQGDNNLFHAQSELPSGFWKGFFINLGWCIIILCLSYFVFLRTMFPAVKKDRSFEKIDLNLVSGNHMAYKVHKEDFITQFLNIFFGKIKKFNGKITLDEKNIVTEQKEDFLYLPNPNDLPHDMKVNTFLVLFKRLLKVSNEKFNEIIAGLDKSIPDKRFETLEPADRLEVLLKVVQMKKSPVYIFEDITIGVNGDNVEEIRAFFQDLKESGALIVDLFTIGSPWATVDSYSTMRYKNNMLEESPVRKLGKTTEQR